ncbi:hypothetical protein QQS21_002224 [Conoideocrella luteorostrata]|uniref:Lysozyme n=1 Tax=Conoideocrella luteorostrata TaxID=1105319 RepID=A0AAJ0G1I8_9HYPO|nr:hypothetical protein QQS21_002224 [Conoideocrella luteorostrata]
MVRLFHSSILLLTATVLAAPERRACTGPPVNDATVQLIRSSEGFEPSPKPDPVGLPTVGYGHKCQNSGCSEVQFPFPLNEDTGTQLLKSDITPAQQCITLGTGSNVHLNTNQYGALVSWTFNIGCGAAKSSSLIKRLNAGEDPNAVIANELPQWNKGGGKVLPGLTTRRNKEVALAQTATDQGALPVNC